jgi:hypothetical protein|tara:strand:- start:140 stop:403 length:264 start_codon:yes stop_codon:yes gene_type:complete
MYSIILPLILASSLLNPEYVQCNLWKYTETELDGKVCIYLGKNGTIAYHYAQSSFRECPKQFQCKYMPNSKAKVSIKDILKGLSDGF